MSTRTLIPGSKQHTFGIRLLDRFIGGFVPDELAERQRAGYLPGIYSGLTDITFCRPLLKKALAEIGVSELIGKARAEHDAKTAELREIAFDLPALAATNAAAAIGALVRDPSPKNAASLLAARAALAQADSAVADIEASLADAEQAFRFSDPHRTALVDACRKLVAAMKKTDQAGAVRVALRAAALADGVASGHPGAIDAAVEMLAGHCGEALPTTLIPKAWLDLRCAPGFKWNAVGNLNFA